MRIYACSDLHVEHAANWKWIEALPEGSHFEEALIVAGDVSTNLDQIRQCLLHLTKVFSYVFYCPGNHEFWMPHDNSFKDSIDKVNRIMDMCDRIGVYTQPLRLDDAWVVPLLSWYDDSLIGPNDVIDRHSLEECWVDYHLCEWPEVWVVSLDVKTRGLARYFADRNEPFIHEYDAPVISFSHMMPRRDLMVPQCFLSFTNLPAVAGSLLIEDQIRTLKSRVHVFGHTHMNHSAVIDGCLYVQNAFASVAAVYPRERERYNRPITFRPVWPLNENGYAA